MGVDIYTVKVNCPRCEEVATIHRKYVEPGESIELKCKKCEYKFRLTLEVYTN